MYILEIINIENCKKLVKKFVDRAVHGYDRMINANKDIRYYRDIQHRFREFDKSKNIGPPSFYFKPRNQKERITVLCVYNVGCAKIQ